MSQSSTKMSQQQNIDKCSICKLSIDAEDESILLTDPITLCCSHKFHAECITQWAYISNTCPLCRCKFNYTKRNGEASTFHPDVVTDDADHDPLFSSPSPTPEDPNDSEYIPSAEDGEQKEATAVGTMYVCYVS